ncbi:MAG: hypothetical protein JWN73_4504 [Betaproteobacteria bacterium]|nr:hypothetical protein [Betaproteobacteria bacterium]
MLNIRLRHWLAVALLCLPGLACALQCTESDRKGNRSIASMNVDKAGAVQSFRWSMRTPDGASCEFDSADFSPVPRKSGTEFKSPKGCRLFVWRQGNSVVLAPNACEAHCSGPEAHDYLWPMVFNRRGKGCGK